MSATRSRRVLLWIGIGLLAVAALVVWLRPAPRPPRETAPAPAPQSQPRPAAPRPRPAPVPRSADQVVRLEGRVLDQAERGVADAEVRLVSHGFTTTTRSDARGAFAFRDLSPDLYFVDAATDTAACRPRRIHLRADTPPVVLHLSAAIRAEITVLARDDGTPVRDAVVEVLDRNSDTPLRSEVTDRAGKVTLRGLPPDGYAVTVSAAGFRTAAEAIPPRAGLAWSHTVRLARGVAVQGRVVDEGGAGVAGATIVPLPAQDVLFLARPKLASHSVVTGRDGEFTMTLDAGSFRLAALHPRYLPGRSEPFAVDGTSPRSGIVIRVAAGGSVAGQVVTAEGRPAAYAIVRSSASRSRDLGTGMREVRADRDGRFLIEGLPRAPLDVVAVAPEASSDTVTVDLSGRPDVSDLVVRLGFDAVIAGTVTAPDHRPIAEAEVFCVGRPRGAVGTRPVFAEITDADGRFTCRGLVPGDYALTATRPFPNNNQGPSARSTTLPGVQAGTTNVVLVLPEDGTLVGKVRLPDGSVPQRFGVAVDSGGLPRVFEGARGGRFLMDGLAPRKYLVRVSVEGFVPAEVEAQVPAGGRVDLGVVTVTRPRPLAPP
jgi:protocatechuate 3,4-dioxygenase beta subunit